MSDARWVLFAYHTFGARCLRALLARGERVVGVVTHADDPREDRWFESVGDIAAAAGVPVLTPASPNAPDAVEAVRALAPDVLLSVWYRRLLGAAVLALPRTAALNLHGSLLPRYRGRAPVNWALVNGERRTGVTLHHMTLAADAGDIVAQVAIDIGPEETAPSLYQRMIEAGARLLVETYPAVLAGTAPRLAQDESRATVYPKRRPEDGRIAWEWPAARIADMIRAVARPYPGAFAGDGDDRVVLWQGRVEDATAAGGRPGTLLAVRPGEGITVATGRGVIRLDRVETPGAGDAAAEAWVGRRRLRPGDRLPGAA